MTDATRYRGYMHVDEVTADLERAHEERCLASIHMHDGSMTEYAAVVGFPAGEGHRRVWIQPHRVLSGSRLTPKGRRAQLTINQIDYVTIHRDKVLPTEES